MCRTRVRTASRALLTSWLLLVLAGGLAAQEPGMRRVEQVLPPAAAARVADIAAEARREGVPPGLIIRKALEGAAKGVPPERIVSSLDRYVVQLREARGILGPDRGPASLAAAAEAMRRGVPPEAVRSLAEGRRRDRDLAVPLIVLGELTEAGVPTDHALEVVNAALARGARADRMLDLSAAVRRRILRGEDWRHALEAVRRRALEDRRRGSRIRPDGGQARRAGPHGRSLRDVPVPPGSEPPTRLRDGSG